MRSGACWLTLTLLLVTCSNGSSRLDDLDPQRRHRHRHGAYAIRDDLPPARHHTPTCPDDCLLNIANQQAVRALFQDYLEESDTQLVYFKVHFTDYNGTLLERYPYMASAYRAEEFVWASGTFGKKLLGLPQDANILSLYVLETNRKHITLSLTQEPDRCFLMHSPECRLDAIRKIIIRNVTHVERFKHHRDFVCHQVINQTETAHAQLIYRCCDTTEFRNGDTTCRVYTSYGEEISSVLNVINVIAVIFTLFSPIVILKVKLFLKFDSVTKFFRASLKHGITGQRNYVIRISSRQLIDLGDSKPFSIPRFAYRILFHCYGEGRCCIHWWGDWHHQPGLCKKQSFCRRCWFSFWRFFAVVVVYPSVAYIALGLYAPTLQMYVTLIKHIEIYFEDQNPLELNVNLIALAFMPLYHPYLSIWLVFAFVAFVYTVLLLSWPNNPLERCLLRYEGKRPFDQPNILYDRMTRGYKAILQKLAYGEYNTKRHFFRIPWIPWGLRRTMYFLMRTLMNIPVINVCFTLLMFDARLFNLRRSDSQPEDIDESRDSLNVKRPSCGVVCKWIITIFVWTGFVLVLLGYCTAVYLMTEFVLNVLFFTFLGAVLHALYVLPWICFSIVMLFYINDSLSMINQEHREILKLIDENSPRISAVEDSEEVFRKNGVIQILKTHNLGAVKFIDGDNTEYVSKELYYNVCIDLKCGWGPSLRRVFKRVSIIALFLLFVFLTMNALGAFMGSGIYVSVTALVLSALPKLVEIYISSRHKKPELSEVWAKIMPDILDRHIRVDRTQCLDEPEENLTTYDVRPVGLLEMEVPRVQSMRTLKLWKFPWVVSADQQTQSHETFIIALANKLAAASFLSKIVTRAYSPDLDDEATLRQWCLLVENCILEGSSTASSINGVPVESIRLFPRDVQPLVAPFETGSTIDNVVDNINRELYGPYTKGVLVTIGNTALALGKLNDTIFAFNSSCHGDQVTDLFGAVLIAADFNTQNLQTTIKYIVDPYSPDSVPVYTVVPIEGFVFKSPEILEIESDLSPE